MADNNKHLVYGILQFLEEEKKRMPEELGESLEVAQQCLETVYDISTNDIGHTLPDSLPVIFANGLKTTDVVVQAEAPLPTSQASVSEDVKAEAESFKAKGNDFMRAERYEEALTNYSKAIDLDMHNAVYFCNRAAAYSKLENQAEALRDCTTAIMIDPGYSKAYGRKGLAHSALNQHKEAKDCYVKALELDPGNASYQQNLEITNQKLAEEAAAAGVVPGMPPGLNLGGMDFSGMLNNPALMNMATTMMSDPNVQNVMANLMSDGAAPEGGMGNLGGLLQAGQQLAQQMQQTNPDLVEQLRTQMGPQDNGEDPPPPYDEPPPPYGDGTS